MKHKKTTYVMVFVGVVLLIAGLGIIKMIDTPQGIMRVTPYVCIGIGCGLFGQGLGTILSERAIHKNPDIRKRMEIEKKDERNVAISNRAKGKAFDMMTFIFGALMLSFALMEIELVATILFVIAYLFIQGYAFYYRFKFEKEM